MRTVVLISRLCVVDMTISYLATTIAPCFVPHEFRTRTFRRDTTSSRLTKFRSCASIPRPRTRARHGSLESHPILDEREA